MILTESNMKIHHGEGGDVLRESGEEEEEEKKKQHWMSIF